MCYVWYSVELDELAIQKHLEERAKYRRGIPLEYPINTFLKLVTNTIYGVLVSPYFNIGNTIVGNNITARARSMAWYIEKELNGYVY